MQKLVLTLFSLTFIASCGKLENPEFLLGKASTKRAARGSLFLEADAFKSVGNSRITNPKSKEDLAINQIQDYYDILQNWKQSLSLEGFILSPVNKSFGLNNAFIYSPAKVLNVVESIKKDMPKDMADIFLNKASFPKPTPFNLSLLNYWNDTITTAYQMAVRWQQLIAPQVGYWKKQQKRDVRGYVFFQTLEDLESKLLNFKKQPDEFKARARESIFTMCLNNGTTYQVCQNEITNSLLEDKIFAIYHKYLTSAEINYNSFFRVQKKASFMAWPDNSTFSMGMSKPAKAENAVRFKSVVENKWKVGEIFKLQVQYFQTNDPRLANLTINNNSLAYVTDYKNMFIAQTDLFLNEKVVSHEAGHLMGLPDCYVEFVDQKTNEAVYYEIDQKNIMCSVDFGAVQEEHFHELFRNY